MVKKQRIAKPLNSGVPYLEGEQAAWLQRHEIQLEDQSMTPREDAIYHLGIIEGCMHARGEDAYPVKIWHAIKMLKEALEIAPIVSITKPHTQASVASSPNGTPNPTPKPPIGDVELPAITQRGIDMARNNNGFPPVSKYVDIVPPRQSLPEDHEFPEVDESGTSDNSPSNDEEKTEVKKYTRLTEEQKDEVAQRYTAGESSGELSRAFLCSIGTIANILRSRDVPMRQSAAQMNHEKKQHKNETYQPKAPPRVDTPAERLIDAHDAYIGRREADQPLVDSDYDDIIDMMTRKGKSLKMIAGDYDVTLGTLEQFIERQDRLRSATRGEG